MIIVPEFIFVRHGQSQANADGLIATDDSPLTELGLEQARKTAAKLKQFKIDVIACSPRLRAQQTAETIAGELGIPVKDIIVVDELGERAGPQLQGKPKEHPSEWYYTNDDKHEESREALIKRMIVCLDKIRELAKPDKTILVVGHGVSGFYLLQVAKGKTSFEEFDPPSQMLNADFVKVKLD